MANEQKTPVANAQELALQKKEERARRARRRSRQLIGLALAVLIVVGAVSVVRGGISAVQGLLEGADEETDQYRRMLEPFVWFDVLPFDSLENADQNALKQVVIWSILTGEPETEDRDASPAPLTVSTERVDAYAQTLFGPGFRFGGHGAFEDEAQGLYYGFDEESQSYIVPETGLQPPYIATVAEVVREGGGVRRVVMGYVSAYGPAEGNQGVALPDLDRPAKYMDFMLRREGDGYYLYALQNNTTHVPDVSSSTAVPPASSAPEDGPDDAASG